MLIDVSVPPLAESVSEAGVLAWHKAPGDTVRVGERLVELETDKIVLDVVAKDNGRLERVLKPEGSSVHSGEVLAQLDTSYPVPEDAPQAATPPADTPLPAAPVLAEETSSAPPKTGPAVRRLAEQRGIDLSQVPHQGERVTRQDLLDFKPASEASPADSETRPQRRVPMSRLRRRAAERLLQAQQQHAILTTFNEVDMHAVMELRSRYKDEFNKTHSSKLGFMSFFTRAVVAALKKFPIINASSEGEDIIYHGYYDIGVAVGSPHGLVVPVLRDADQLSFAEIEAAIADFASRARSNQLRLEDLEGGTFTITNGGIFGSMLSTPILNPPQSAILGMHNIVERPVAVNGEVRVRPVMYVALSYDHRLIDGRDAVQFLVAVKHYLEDPARLLLEL